MSCPNYHVYVIELRREVLVEKPKSKSIFLHPILGDLPPEKRVFYVGETAHSPECRYQQHIADSQSRKEFSCNCNLLDTNKNHENLARKFPLPVKKGYVRDYAKEMHHPDFLGGGFRNPTREKTHPDQAYPGSREAARKDSKEEERRLGCYLRSLGHAVYWGPSSLDEGICTGLE